MLIKWLGHSAFSIRESGRNILIDPFLGGNPICPGDTASDTGDVDAIVLTHGHGDHLGDAAAIARGNECPVFAIYEICNWLEAQGVEKCEPMNTGGSVAFGDGIKVTLVNAEHSASIIEDGGRPLYMGCACGAVISGPTCTLYHAGDTGIFSDMSLIQRIYKPEVGLVPIGDRFTMGPETAAIACNEFLDLKVVVPMHYGTFPLISGQAEDFARRVTRGEVRIMAPGETTEFSRA